MRMAPDRPWLPFEAEQTFSAVSLDFRWKARARLNRWLPMTVIDAFKDGRGLLLVRLFGILPVARSRGPVIDKGKVMRAIAELPWRPFGFVEQALNWTVNAAGALRALYDDGRIKASVDFDVDTEGRVLGIRAEDRPRAAGKSIIETPWSGTFSEYRMFGAIRVPTKAEVTWHLPEGVFTWWRGRITAFRLVGKELAN